MTLRWWVSGFGPARGAPEDLHAPICGKYKTICNAGVFHKAPGPERNQRGGAAVGRKNSATPKPYEFIGFSIVMSQSNINLYGF